MLKIIRAGYIGALAAMLAFAPALAGTVGQAPTSGPGLQDGTWLNGLAGGLNQFYQSGITAHAGGGQTSGFQLPTGISLLQVDTVASSADSVLLPICIAPTVLTLRNNAASNAMNVYASPNTNLATATTDTINALSNATAYSMPAASVAVFNCIKNGQWAGTALAGTFTFPISPTLGGSGVANAAASTLTLGAALTTTGTQTPTLAFGNGASTTQTFPTTSATLARTDAAQTLTGTQTVAGQIVSAAGLPTIASGACGATTNGAVVAGSTNQAGAITIGSASTSTCTIAFSATLAAAPKACIIQPNTTGAAAVGTTAAYVSSITTAQFVITGTLASTGYYFWCL